MRPRIRWCALWLLFRALAPAQVIEFENNGLKYQTLTKNGVTVMFTQMPSHVREFWIFQVAVANGTKGPYTIRPQDFTWTGPDGTTLRADAARDVVALLMEKGSRSDVIKLVSAYEAAIYGIPHMRPTNGYESRRQAALAEVASMKLKAAAAASAIALVQTKLDAGQSTDGAVFFPREGKDLPPGHLVLNTGTDIFEFNPE